jgi:hypothetical protein
MSEKPTKKGRPADADRQDNGQGLRGQLQAAYAERTDTPAASAAPAPEPAKPQDDGPPVPASWKADAKAHWSNLHPDLKQYLSGREREIERGFSRFDEDRNLGRAMRDALAPYAGNIQKAGVRPHQAVAHLLGFENTLRNGSPEQKLNAIHMLARDYGINLDAVIRHQPNLADPTIAQLQSQIRQLREAEHRRQQHHEQQQLAQAHAEVDDFKTKNPHFDAVRAQMHELISKGAADTLQEAYDMAVWANPTLRQTLIAGQADQSRQATDQQRRTAAAKKAGSSIAGNPGATKTSAAANGRSLRDELAANLKAATGRI